MNEATRKKIVYSILVVAVIWGGFNIKMPDTVKEKRQNHATIAKVIEVQAQLEKQRDELIKTYSRQDWGKDPFKTVKMTYKPKKKVVYNIPKWKLTGIMYNSNNPLAVINKKAVSVGDRINKGKVISIKKDKVIIEHSGKQYTLKVTKG